jgi:hypothetical protein
MSEIDMRYVLAVQEAKIKELEDALRASLPQRPPIAGDPAPEPDPGSVEEMRQGLAMMADTDDIEAALEKFLLMSSKPLVLHHPYAPSHTVRVIVDRVGGRIALGDWLEYQGNDDRLDKQIGRHKTLGRVVGNDALHRPQVRWHDGKYWHKKPYSLFAEGNSAVRVLYDWQAAGQYPEPFITYPTKKVPPAKTGK